MNAQEKKNAAALDVKQLLAANGIYALKGNDRFGRVGFWLFRGIGDDADAKIRAGLGFCLLTDHDRLTCIENDNKASGNNCFWTFRDARRLAVA